MCVREYKEENQTLQSENQYLNFKFSTKVRKKLALPQIESSYLGQDNKKQKIKQEETKVNKSRVLQRRGAMKQILVEIQTDDNIKPLLSQLKLNPFYPF